LNVLDIKMQPNDADASTVKDYLKALLTELWNKGEGFSSKRPFGNSGWEYDLYTALAIAGVVESEYREEYEEYINIDEGAANELIFEAITSL